MSSLAEAGRRLRQVPGLAMLLDARLSLQRYRRERRARAREDSLVRRDQEWLRSLEGRDDLRLNVGSSGQHIDGWISADLLRDPDGRCLVMDATRPWPFANQSAVAILAEHMIEHLDPRDVPTMLGEAFRVLQPGGVLRVSTPDLEGLCRTYLDMAPETVEIHRRHGYEARNHADLVNNYFYLWEHRHIYDFATLRSLLLDAGFADIDRQGFGESRHEVLRGIDRHDPDGLAQLVVTVDALKPQVQKCSPCPR